LGYLHDRFFMWMIYAAMPNPNINKSRLANFAGTTIEALVFETVLNFAQIVASIAQCSSEHMACIFRLGLVRFTDLFKVFESYFQFPFQKIAPYLDRHLIFFVWHGATVARILHRFRQP
jgi:hypothetical protein